MIKKKNVQCFSESYQFVALAETALFVVTLCFVHSSSERLGIVPYLSSLSERGAVVVVVLSYAGLLCLISH